MVPGTEPSANEPRPSPPPAAPTPAAPLASSPLALPPRTTAKRARRRRDWTRIFLEGFFVALGVLLALVADEWRQSAAERRHARAALDSIREELHSNEAAVRRSLDYHLMLTGTLRNASTTSDTARAPSSSLFSRGFVSPAPVLQTAWDSARSTDALSHMDYADVLSLARVYERQGTYGHQAQEVGGIIFDRIFESGIEGMLKNTDNLNAIISTFWYQECGLLREYAQIFEQLDGKKTDAPRPQMCDYVAAPK